MDHPRLLISLTLGDWVCIQQCIPSQALDFFALTFSKLETRLAQRWAEGSF